MDAYNLLGNVCDRRGDYAAALVYRQADHELAFSVGNSTHRAHALLRLGGSYFRLGDYPTALNLFLQARSLFDLTDNAGRGSVWNHIGNVHYAEDHWEAALEAHQTGLAQFEHNADPYWQAGLLSNIAGVYLKENKVGEARTCLEQSLALREAVGDRHGQGYSLNSLSEIFRREGNISLARTYGLRALSLFEQIGDQAGQAQVRLNLATVEGNEQQWDTAERYLTESLAYTEAQGLREISYQIHSEWSRLCEEKGDVARALYHFKQFHTIKDALLNETTVTRLRNLEVVHRVAQAQSEADLLRRHNALLAAANARQAELLTQLQHQATALETLSRTDALTGLLNRRSLQEQFTLAHGNARKQHAPLSVALLDLDHFKRINDRFSHQTGDAVLRTVARLLTENCRPTDLVARYGGEEFVLVMPGMTLGEASPFCDHIRRLIASYPWRDLHPDLHVTISLGLCGDASLATPEQMLSWADARLYEAKAAGRNRTYA